MDTRRNAGICMFAWAAGLDMLDCVAVALPCLMFYFAFVFDVFDNSHQSSFLHIKVRLPVLLCAVKTVEGDFRFC